SPFRDSPSGGFVGAGRPPLGVAERRHPMDLGGGVARRRRVPRGCSGGSRTEETDYSSNPHAARAGTPPSGILGLALPDHDRRREGLRAGPCERAHRGLRSARVHAAAGKGRDLVTGGPGLVGDDRSTRFTVPRPGSQIVDPRTVNFDVHPLLSLPWLSAWRHCRIAGAGSAPAAANRGTAFARRLADRSGPHRGAELDRRGPAFLWANGIRPRTAGGPLASRGLLLPRDDGQLPGIDAAGEPRPGRSGGLVSGGLPGRGRSSAGSTPRTRSSVDSPRNRGPLPGDSP